MTGSLRIVGINALLHFLVDGICACCLFQMLADHDVADTVAVILTYDILAFMTQPLTGWVADFLNGTRKMLLVAVALLVAAVAVADIAATGELTLFCVAVLLGMGNSLFHVWGGKSVAVSTGNDIRALGVFVATGAVGLTTGILFHSWPLLLTYVVMICGVSARGSIYLPEAEKCVEAEQVTTSPRHSEWGSWGEVFIFLLLLMSVVMFRSFLGEAFGLGIEKDTTLILIISATVLAGKMSGGWIARRFGIVRSMAVVVVGIAVCAFLRESSIIAFLFGLFLINTTMPVTLYLANVLLPKREGLAFGLLAAVLVPGYLLAQLL